MLRHQLSSDYDPRQRPWYQSALKLPTGDMEGVTAPYLDAGSRRPVITFFRKVLHPDQSFVGVLGVDIDVETASSSISEDHPVPPGGLKILVKSDGTILIHPDPTKVGVNINAFDDPLHLRISRRYWQHRTDCAAIHRENGKYPVVCRVSPG